jgi:hypothetical protein
MLMYTQYWLVLAVVCFLCVAITPLTLSLTTDSKYITPVDSKYHYHSNVFDLYLVGCATCVCMIVFWEDLITKHRVYVPVGLLVAFILVSAVKIAFVADWNGGSDGAGVDWLLTVLLGIIVGVSMIPLIVVSVLNAFHKDKDIGETKKAATTTKYSSLLQKPGHSALDRLITNTDEETNDVESSGNKQSVQEEDTKQHATFSRLMRWSYPEWKLTSFAIVMLIFASACTMAQPLYFGKIIGEVSQAHPDREKIKAYVYILLVIFTVGGTSTAASIWPLCPHLVFYRCGDCFARWDILYCWRANCETSSTAAV